MIGKSEEVEFHHQTIGRNANATGWKEFQTLETAQGISPLTAKFEIANPT
jgi:hypothetical protein